MKLSLVKVMEALPPAGGASLGGVKAPSGAPKPPSAPIHTLVMNKAKRMDPEDLQQLLSLIAQAVEEKGSLEKQELVRMLSVM